MFDIMYLSSLFKYSECKFYQKFSWAVLVGIPE